MNSVEGIINDFKTQNSFNNSYQEWLCSNKDAIDLKNKIQANVIYSIFKSKIYIT